MQENERNQNRKSSESDSPFARGIGLKARCRGPGIEAKDYSGRAFEILQALAEAGALTHKGAEILLGNKRWAANKALTALWYAGMANWYDVISETGVFRLWVPAETVVVKNPQEACRLAALGLFYALAKNEVPGFKWRMIRNGKNGVTAEMHFTISGNTTQWIIDAPRRDEDPVPHSDVYIFPTINEGKTLTPAGKMYTADELLFTPGELRRKIFQRTS